MFDEKSLSANPRCNGRATLSATAATNTYNLRRTAFELVKDSALRLAGKAFAQAYSAAEALDNVIIPELPRERQPFANDLRRRVEGVSMLDKVVRRDLETLLSYIDECIDAHTEFGWISDDHHFLGGYEVCLRDDTAKCLGAARDEIVALRDSLSAALSARHVAQMLQHVL